MVKGKPMLDDMNVTAREFVHEAEQEFVAEAHDEVKRQVPLRLPQSVVKRITQLAGRKTMTTGRRVTNQDLLEAAVMNFLKREEAALRREAKKSDE